MDQNMQSEPKQRGHRFGGGYRYRSLFWAIVLIGAGAIWLLHNLDAISVSNLAMLGLLWPILLIGIGVDLLVGHRSPVLGGLVGAVTVGLVVLLMLLGPSLGWAGETEYKKEIFSTPVGNAVKAQVELELAQYPTTISALPRSADPGRALLSASVEYRGKLSFKSSGDAERTVSLSSGAGSWW